MKRADDSEKGMTKMKKPLLILLATGALSTLVALAADQPAPGGAPGGPGAGPGGANRGPRGNFQGPGRGGMAGLDEQQRQVYQQALQKDGAKLRTLNEKLRLAQKDLLGAVLGTNYDEKVVQGKAEAVSRIQVELTMVRAEALAAVAPTMKPDQKQQVIDSPMGIALLNAGGMGGPMGGGPRGGGPGGGAPGFGPGGGPGGAAGFGPGGGPGGGPGNPPGDGFPAGGRDPLPRER